MSNIAEEYLRPADGLMGSFAISASAGVNAVSSQVDDSRNFMFTVLGRQQDTSADLQRVKNCVICYGERRVSSWADRYHKSLLIFSFYCIFI